MDFEGVNCTNSDNLISACIECTAYETHISNERRREEKKFIERTEKGIRRQSEKIKTTSKQKYNQKVSPFMQLKWIILIKHRMNKVRATASLEQAR